MSTVSNSRSEFWTTHFAKLAETESSQNEQLDFSNHALVVQNYSFVLESCGAIANKRILDAGFGTGEFARVLDLLGGRVSAVDVVSNRIPLLRQAAPNVAWWKGDLGEWTLPPNAETFELITAVESLQYVDFEDAVDRLMSALSPTGRLVVLIPNSDCPIVKRTSERFDSKYLGVSMRGLPQRFTSLLQRRLQACDENWYAAYRGIYFQEDQTLVPYRSGSWIPLSSVPPSHHAIAEARHNSLQGPHRLNATPPANRLQIVISRAETDLA